MAAKPKEVTPVETTSRRKATPELKQVTPTMKKSPKQDPETVTNDPQGAKGAIRLKVSPTTRAILDFLCDGRWHTREETLVIGVKACLEGEYPRAVDEGKRVRRGRQATTTEYADSGARQFARNNLMIAVRNNRVQVDETNTKVRMSAAAARQWRRDRSAEEASAPTEANLKGVVRQRFGDEQIFAGMLEFDAWAYAPLYARDVAYVRPNTDVDLDEMRETFPNWDISIEPDGLISIAAPVGTPVKDVVTEYLAQQGIHHEGVRDARNVRRRNINELPQDFLRELVTHYTRYAQRRVRERHAASMQRLVGDPDDIAGEVALWVMECIAGFDATHGVPFGAWLTKQLPNRVMDLNRASFGRTAADAEMRRARVIEGYEAAHGHAPTQDELRKTLGLTRDEMIRKERDLANLRGLRSTSTLETGPDAPELPVVDMSSDPEGDVLNLELMQSVSRALLSASGEWDIETGRPVHLRRLGFLIVYLMHWQEWTKGDLTILAGRAARAVSEEVDAVQKELAERLSDLRADRTATRTNDVIIVQ